MAAVPDDGITTWPKSNTYVADITITASGGGVYDLTGATVLWMLKQSYDEADPGVLSKTTPAGGITVTNAAAGTCVLTVTDTEMAALTAGQTYVWDLQVQALDGTTATVRKGSLKIDPVVRQGYAV